LCVLAIASCSPTQKTQVELPQSHTPGANEKALLWQISGKALTQPSYLYGTIHMIDQKDFFLTDSTLAAFGRMEKVVFEIDMQEMNDPTVLFSLLSQAMMADGKTLKDLLNANDYELVNQYFNQMGLPMYLLERVKPLFLSMFVSSDFSGEGLQNGEVKSYEMEFMKMAEDQGKAAGGLETLAFQLSVFDSIPYTEQANRLVDAIKLGDQSAEAFEEMIRLYKAQDIVAMQKLFSEEEGTASSNFESVLLTKRNRNWIPIMEEMMQSKPTFFAVGAGHLGGKDGVIALMRKAGYQMQPILAN
ncbi:MAG: TraB/GumN family protein, partial [Bacteroidota bacterium]